jgi:DNA modification methylase
MATECGNKSHSAAFPISLPSWFIELFTQKNDVVLDPFVGSGTTAVAAVELGRKYIGIDISKEYCDLARERTSGIQMQLLTIKSEQGIYNHNGSAQP